MNPVGRILKAEFKVTLLLFLINAVLFFFVNAIAAVFSTSQETILYLFGAEYFPDIITGQFWRLVLPAFLHANLLHFFVNMWALVNIGPYVESFYGRRKLIAVYVVTGIFSSLFSVLITAVNYFGSGGVNTDFGISIGASGAIFGLVGLLLGNNYKSDTYSLKIPIDTTQLWIFVAFNIILGFGFNSLGGGIGINNAAHVGGLISGFVLGVVINPINTFHVTKLKKYFENGIFYFAVAVVVASALLNIIFNFT